MRVYPVPGLPLRDPVKGDFVPDEGREVADSPFWRRRLKVNDASLTPPKTTPTSAQTAPLVVIEETALSVLVQDDESPLVDDQADADAGNNGSDAE
jgi:hypothetical protein